jgi:hypothetical protein
MGGPSLRVPVVTPNRRLDRAGRLLAIALATGPPAAAEDLRAASDALVEWAVHQGVTGLLHQAAAGRLAEPADARLAEIALLDAGNHHLRGVLALDRLAGALHAGGHAWVVVKGPVLVETAYAGVSRPYFDLDLLVSPAEFPSALEALEEAGAELIDRNWELLIRQGRAQVSLKDRSTGLTVDLHWHLVNLARLRRTFALPTDELLDRRVTLELGSVSAPVLERTDRFIHYALHAANSGGHRLIWLADLSQVMKSDPPDWDEVLRRCNRWKVELPVAVMLARVEATLGCPAPAGVVESLAGGRMRQVLTDWLAVWEPGGRLPGGGSVRHGVTESLSGSLSATTRLTALSAGAMVRRLWDRYPHWLDPDDPGHVEYDAGGASGRRRYLAGVGKGAA